MTLAPTTSARPPKQSPPDERDCEIFKLAEIHRWTHDKIALEKDISRRRVSQIVQEVRHWYSNHTTDDPALDSELERQRYARNLERLRLEDIIERAVHALDSAPTALATTRSTDGGQITRTLRDQPPVDVRLLRMYLRAVTALSKLNDRPDLPAPPPPAIEGQPWLEPRIQEVVKAWQGTAKSYHLTEVALSKFAEELTLSFLGCLNPPEPLSVPGSSLGPHNPEAPASFVNPTYSPTTAGLPSSGSCASHASLAEAPPDAAFSLPPNDSTASDTDTSVNHTEDNHDQATPETPTEKPEKGSAARHRPLNPDPLYPQYEKPLHIGPMPMPTARRQPVTQLTVTPNQPGVAKSRATGLWPVPASELDTTRDPSSLHGLLNADCPSSRSATLDCRVGDTANVPSTPTDAEFDMTTQSATLNPAPQ